MPPRWRGFVAIATLLFSWPVTAEYALGDSGAPVKIVEYASFSCRYCVQFHRAVFPLLKARHIDTGRVQFIYRHYPTSSAALRGAVAAHCAGSAWYYEMLDVLYLSVARWQQAPNIDEALVQEAASLGLDEAQFAACLNEPQRAERIRVGQRRAQATHGVRGTPTFIINGQVVRGLLRVDELNALIERALLATNGS